MLLEIAVADAFGAAFEFNPSPEVPNDLSRFGRHGSGLLPAGAYTDDTLRTLANADVLLQGGDAPFRPESYAEAYLAIRSRDDRAGWSRRFEAMLDAHGAASAMEFMRALKRQPTNGCVMGAAVLGFLPTPDEVRLAATMQTVSTHSPSAAVHAQVVALAAHHLLHGGTTRDVVDFAVEGAEWADDGQRRRFLALVQDPPAPEMPAPTIAAGALWGVTAFHRESGALRWACSRGRDADSLAAVTIALASVSRDMVSDLPAHLVRTVDTLEGRETLDVTEKRLRAAFPEATGRSR